VAKAVTKMTIKVDPDAAFNATIDTATPSFVTLHD
jgi:hypothetical protein